MCVSYSSWLSRLLHRNIAVRTQTMFLLTNGCDLRRTPHENCRFFFLFLAELEREDDGKSVTFIDQSSFCLVCRIYQILPTFHNLHSRKKCVLLFHLVRYLIAKYQTQILEFVNVDQHECPEQNNKNRIKKTSTIHCSDKNCSTHSDCAVTKLGKFSRSSKFAPRMPKV